MNIRDLNEFNFDLPDDRIAKFPSDKRDESKLMLVDISNNSIQSERHFKNIINFLSPNDILVYNSTRVSYRRVYLYTINGREHECIFLDEKDSRWICLIKNSSKLFIGDKLSDKGNKYKFTFDRMKSNESILSCDDFAMDESVFEEIGNIPIPPYLKRKATEFDKERYQTVFAKESGSVAAPTAGLHFTDELKRKLEAKGIVFVEILLHVGYGTFSPLSDQQLETGKLHKEKYFISEETCETLNNRKGKLIAIGTTTLRALESAFDSKSKKFKVGASETDIFLKPGDEVNSIDGLITNFHLPMSSLLLLVAAFANKEIIMNAYRKGIDENYRFYSYGDSMFLFKK